MDIDPLELAQFVSSRLCHDLAGPVGVIGTMIEMVSDDDGGSLDDEAMAVLERGANEAAARLAFFRAAFGYGGGAEAGLSVTEIEALIVAIVPTDRMNFRCEVISETGEPLDRVPNPVGKLAMILALIGSEALPHGGSLTLHFARLQDGIGLGVRAEGREAAIKDAVRSALEPDGATADKTMVSRNVHAHVAATLARQLSAALEVSDEADAVGIATLIAG